MPTADSLATAAVSGPAVSALTPAVFVALSSGLTGVPATHLKPASDLVDVALRFYATLRARVPVSILDRMAELFLSAATPAEGAAAVLDDPELGPVGRSILKLWLLGAWQEPGSPGAAAIDVLAPHDYRQSLVWRALQCLGPRADTREII